MLKVKDGFILREVAGQIVVIPTADELNLNIMITLNGTGKFLWEHLVKETTEEALVDALLGEYDVDRATAAQAVTSFVEKLRENDLLD